MAVPTSMRTMASLAALALALALGCSGQDPDSDSWADCDDGKCDQEVAPLAEPDLLVNDLAVLGELERGGFDLGSRLGGAGATSNAMLTMASPLFRQIGDWIDADLKDIQTNDPKAAVGLAAEHRLFDAKWLRAASARFRLVAVINRTDNLAHTPGACGEVRFAYRMMYSLAKGSSRLPMTMLLVHEQPQIDGGCAEVAKRWIGKTATADALTTGPLATIGPLARIEINLQSVRWPVGQRPDLGGHAEYLLRVFEVDGQSLAPQKLTNTISSSLTDVQKASLKQWILDNLSAIDRGTARVPDEYLATKVFSVSPRGLARGANRPYLLAFPQPEQTFAGVDLSKHEVIKTPGGLVRRLDTMSCQGCHQSRGLAGFHILGQEDATADPGNSIQVGTSPHLHEELRWRRQALSEIAASGELRSPRPMADRFDGVPGIYGAHCGLGDPSFASWTCADGFTCVDVNGEEIGMCQPSVRGAGDACETSSVTLAADAKKDRMTDMLVHDCKLPTGAGKCSRSIQVGAAGGFPNGSCSGACSKMGVSSGAAICGASPASGFNECLGRGESFSACLANANPAFRRRCDAQNPCGDDYVCASVKDAPRGVGACMPPYFIFQARVDGHKVP